MDLADVYNLKKQNDGVAFLLCVIDVLSKYAWYPENGERKFRGLRKIYLKGRTSTRTLSIRSRERIYQFKAFKSIHFFTTRNTDTKSSIVKRFQRTLKARMWQYFTRNETRRYLDIFPDLVYDYNHSFHRSIQRAPVEVNSSNVLRVWSLRILKNIL